MRYAIRPRGIAKTPGARCILDAGALTAAETFSVPELGYSPDLVLAEDQVSLRAKTQPEIDAEAAAAVAEAVEQADQAALAADAKLDAVFTALATATPGQIAVFVSNRFPAFDPDQRAVIRLLLKGMALFLRRLA